MLNENLQKIGLPFVVWAVLMIVTDILTITYLGPGWDSKEKVVSTADKTGEMTGSFGETPTPSPFGEPTQSPFGEPTQSPFGEPTPSPFGEPTPSPVPGTSSALRSSRVSESKSASTLVSEIDPADWRRKWILSFAWLKLVIFILMFFVSVGTITLVPIINIFLGIWIFYNIIVILALGPTLSYDETKPYYIDEWKRKFILLVCWFSIVLVILSVISYLSPSVYGPQKKWEIPRLNTFMRRPENRRMGSPSRALITTPGAMNF